MLGGTMRSPILVTGGTGTLGRLVVRRLRDAGYDDLRVLSRHHQGRRGKGPELGTGGITGGGGASGVHLRRRRGPHPDRQPSRPRHVRLLRVQAGRRTDRGRLRPAVHDAARNPVSRPDPDSGTADGKAAGGTGSGRLPLPTRRRRRGGGPARRTHSRRASEQGARYRWAASVRRGRPAPRLPSGQSSASADRAGLAAGQGRPRVPGRRQPDSRAGRGPPEVGGVPGREAELKGNGLTGAAGLGFEPRLTDPLESVSIHLWSFTT